MSMAPSTSAAAARVSLVLSLLIFASSISASSSSSSSSFASPQNRLGISGSAARRRAILAHAAGAAAGGAECRELGSREECARSPRRCRWCRSDAIDDMCFGSAEAWRLPHQVFSCDPIPLAAAS